MIAWRRMTSTKSLAGAGGKAQREQGGELHGKCEARSLPG